MAHYGKILDTSFDPEKDNIRRYFLSYFNYPVMFKIKNVDIYSIYMTKTYCLLSNQCRYIVAMVDRDDLHVSAQKNLSDLNWVSLQTRTLSDKHNIPSHNYTPTKQTPLSVQIKLIEKTQDYIKYECSKYPIEVTILTKDNNNSYPYRDSGNLVSAIEIYYTIITFTNNNNNNNFGNTNQ